MSGRVVAVVKISLSLCNAMGRGTCRDMHSKSSETISSTEAQGLCALKHAYRKRRPLNLITRRDEIMKGARRRRTRTTTTVKRKERVDHACDAPARPWINMLLSLSLHPKHEQRRTAVEGGGSTYVFPRQSTSNRTIILYHQKKKRTSNRKARTKTAALLSVPTTEGKAQAGRDGQDTY